jgi:hypothetical protein
MRQLPSVLPAAAALSLALFLVGAPVRAQIPCEDDPAQEVGNCSFETGPLTGWTTPQGALASSAAARSGAVAAEIAAGARPVEGGFFEAKVFSSCFPATFVPGYGFGAWLRLESGAITNGPCQAQLYEYPDGSCASATNSTNSTEIVPNASGWLLSSGVATAPSGTHGQLVVECPLSTTDFTLLVDDAFAGPDLTVPVTLQTFTVE